MRKKNIAEYIAKLPKEIQSPESLDVNEWIKTVARILGWNGFKGLCHDSVNLWVPSNNNYSRTAYGVDRKSFYYCHGRPDGFVIPCGNHSFSNRFVWLFEDGTMISSRLEYNHDYRTDSEYLSQKDWEFYTANDMTGACSIFLNSPQQVLESVNPYAARYAEENNINPAIFVVYPMLEQVKKAGFEIADAAINVLNQALPRTLEDAESYAHSWVHNLSMKPYVLAVQRAFRKATSLYDILGMDKRVANSLKSIDKIMVWDNCRKLYKKGLFSEDCAEYIMEKRIGEGDFARYYTILSCTYNGKPIFTLQSLLRYLNRVDMYEAIDENEALQLITDYIRSCKVMSVKPHFDTDSLKREHDVMARNARIKYQQERQEKLRVDMEKSCEDLAKLDYSEKVFFIRGIRDFDDLVDEATQQSNCVACYANGIAKGTSKIYVMREVANPEKSLITVEISANGKIRQKFLAHNQPIRNKAQTEFLERWSDYCREKLAA